jgi:hypothetical protein
MLAAQFLEFGFHDAAVHRLSIAEDEDSDGSSFEKSELHMRIVVPISEQGIE